MDEFTVNSKGQVTLPRQLRQKLGIRAGSRVRFRVVDGHIQLEVVANPDPAPASGFGLLRSRRKSVRADFDVASLCGKP